MGDGERLSTQETLDLARKVENWGHISGDELESRWLNGGYRGSVDGVMVELTKGGGFIWRTRYDIEVTWRGTNLGLVEGRKNSPAQETYDMAEKMWRENIGEAYSRGLARARGLLKENPDRK